jgi:ABC-type antimicrobial peptide transport system permease subunit
VLPQTILAGLLLAMVMGLLSGLAPALSAARLKIANALRKVA